MASTNSGFCFQWQEIALVCPETNEVVKIVVDHNEMERLENDPEYARAVLLSHREVLQGSNAEEVHCEPVADEDLAESVNDPQYRWSHEATLLLIHLYDENKLKMSSPKYTNTSVFAIIAAAIQAKGHDASSKQCETKWTTLKRTYKKIKDHNGKSGNGAKTWLYFQAMDDILGRRPEMDPISTADSEGMSSMSSSAPYSPNSSSSSRSACPSPISLPVESPPTSTELVLHSRKRKLSQQEMFDKMMNDRKARHTERMEKQAKMLELMEKLVNKNTST